MITFRRVAQAIRHLPGLERVEGLWRVLRKPYHWVLNRGGSGVLVMAGGNSPIWIPAEYAGGTWEHYEPESFAAYSGWARGHPGGLVLDIGSSIGIFSAAALFAEPSVEVVAFDSDLPSLAAVRRVCSHAKGNRLRLVFGLIAEVPTESVTLAIAADATDATLAGSGLRGEVGTTRYVCVGDPGAGAVPVRRLDDLLAGQLAEGRPVLIKCDVEGAELLVLRGAESLLRRARPDLLLSVHPPALPAYGHTVEGVRAFLEGFGYTIQCIAVDHEEHWWCEPSSNPAG